VMLALSAVCVPAATCARAPTSQSSASLRVLKVFSRRVPPWSV
jgi:hypothetical protein